MKNKINKTDICFPNRKQPYIDICLNNFLFLSYCKDESTFYFEHLNSYYPEFKISYKAIKMKDIFLEIHNSEIFLNFYKKYSEHYSDWLLTGIAYTKDIKKISLVIDSLENQISEKNYKVII